MLFNFTLKPLKEVGLWSRGSDGANLHWFGLTDGEYWMEAGEQTLFEYGDQAQALGKVSRYCDYQVVQLYEDVLAILSGVLEPVPPDFRALIEGDKAKEWIVTVEAWAESEPKNLDEEQVRQMVEDACSWFWRRDLYSPLLLGALPAIRLWSDEASVHIWWDLRGRQIEGVPAWSAELGTYQLSREEFLREVRSFHDRLMGQMAERVQEVIAGGLSPEIKIDLAELAREQEERSKSLDRARLVPTEPTNWELVRYATAHIQMDMRRRG